MAKLSKILARRWSESSVEQKRPFELESERMRIEYNKRMGTASGGGEGDAAAKGAAGKKARNCKKANKRSRKSSSGGSRRR